MGIKLLVSSLGVVGGGGVIPLALWQSGYIGGAKQEGTPVTFQATSSEHSNSSHDPSLSPKGNQMTISPAKNCVVSEKESEEEIFSELTISSEDYSVISCENTGNDLARKWRGYFPNSVFSISLDPKEQIEIRTESKNSEEEGEEDDSSYNFKTTFVSGAFVDGSIVGEWSDEREIKEQKITPIKIVEGSRKNESAYLIFEKRN